MPLYPAIADAYRKVVVTTGTGGGGVPGTATSHEVGGELNLDAGFGISLVTDVLNNKVTIVNTGNGTGALTTITENNSNGTYYPIFTRSPPGTQTFTVGASDFTSGVVTLGLAEIRITGSSNSPTAVSAPLRAAIVGLIPGETFSLIKVSDGATLNFTVAEPPTGHFAGEYDSGLGCWRIYISAAPVINDTFVSITIATGVGEMNPITGTYQMDTMYLDQTTTPLTYNPSLGLLTVNTLSVGSTFAATGHVTLEGVTSTGATGTGNLVFSASPTFTGTVSGITQSMVGLSNVTNESKATMFTSPTFTGHPTIEGVTSTGATGTGNLVFSASPTFTGTVSGITATMVGLGNVTNESKATMFSSPTFTGTVSGVTATMVGLGNVTNESKATMFTDPTFTGTVSGVTATMVGLGNVTNESKATMFTSPTFTGHPTIEGVTSTGATGTGNLVFSASPTFSGTVSGITATMVGLGNVTNESKATMFTSPTFTGHATVEGVTATGATGTGKFVFDGSPTLVTPTLGTATATSINKMAITAPATSSTLAIADGKTFTVSNTITLAGTDSTTITLPSTTGTVALNSQTFYIGTTSVAINRASANLALTGITSIDGSAASVANSVTFNTTGGAAAGSTFNGSAARTIDYSTVGAAPAAGSSSITTVGTLGSLTVTNNISTTAGMFSSPLATKTSTSAGTAGQVAWDANYIYICTAANTWKRVALTAGVF